ncbi:MAG: hypothetical protein QOG23_1958 [Blastocatellia bacterium]|jgi:hypothetical protein|nr:hypothetical protein [Blastocatellia bacterium]
MPNEVTEQSSEQERVPAAPPSASGQERPPETDEPGQTVDAIKDAPAGAANTDRAPRLQLQSGGRDQGREHLQVLTENTQAGILSVVGDRSSAVNVSLRVGSDDKPKLDTFITIDELQRCERSYKSLESSTITAYSGLLLQERILLLSCYDDDIALNAATALAYQIQGVKRELMTVDEEGQVNHNFRELIDWLAGRNAKDDLVAIGTANVCLWIATDNTESDAPSAIIQSLLSNTGKIRGYKQRLTTHGLCLICVLPPRQIQEYKSTKLKAPLLEWKIDFLSPLLEDHGDESLAGKIIQQRNEGKWKKDDGEFYKEIVECLRAKNLTTVIEIGRQASPVDASMASQLFNRADPLMDAVLYCATYFPNLSPQDFSYLVELYLGDTTEEVVKRPEPTATQDGTQPVSVVEATPLVLRWKRETDAILRHCKLASVRNENHRRVVDFQVDSLRAHLKEYIRDEHYFFYDFSFNLLRRRGLLFSPKKELAEGARQLLVEVALQYDAEEAAAWLYEVIDEFEQLAEAAGLVQEHSDLFQLLPDSSIKAARNYVGRGLSLVLNRLNREPKLQGVVRVFWQRLLRFQQQWFLDLLRRMGSVMPPETLSWLKQLLDQGTREIRRQACDYLVGYLVHQDALVYQTLNEIMLWPTNSRAGESAQEILIVYCIASNGQLPQREYGVWPSSHPLFGFQDRIEAGKYLDQLIAWLFRAAREANPDSAPLDIADIVAGWYFVLTPSDHHEPNIVDEGSDMLTTQFVRRLLLTTAVRHCSRPLKNSLLERWSEMKSDILEEVIQLEALASHFKSASLSSELMSNVAIVQRKLKDTRARLSELRQDFVRAEEITSTGGATNEQYG